jgi:hypothetical protein
MNEIGRDVLRGSRVSAIADDEAQAYLRIET